MAKINFEFIVEGPPYSVNSNNAKKKNEWLERVGRAAYRQWQTSSLNVTTLPITVPLEVHVTTYYTATIKDVDNVLKYTLDGLRTRPGIRQETITKRAIKRGGKPVEETRYEAIYQDDIQIYKLISERVDLNQPLPDLTSAVVVNALKRDLAEFVHIRLTWNESE